MNVLQIHSESDLATAELVLAPRQCAVVQCNYEHGRRFVRSVLGEASAPGYKALYRGEPLDLKRPGLAGRIGFSLLDDGFYERMNAKDYLRFWLRLHESGQSVDDLLRTVGLEDRAHVRIAKLSFSEKRRLGFARSVAHDPELVVWEDPEQNLDLESCILIRRMIAGLVDRGKTVLVTCSALEQALSLSDNVFRLTETELLPVATQDEPDTSELAPHGPGSPKEGEGGELPDVPRKPVFKLEKLMIKTEDKFVFLDPSNVFFVASNDGQSRLHTSDGDFACSRTLTELEERLAPYRFYRCHRSYLVNLDYAAELIVWTRNSYSLVIRDGNRTKIPLSKLKFEELRTLVES